MRLIDYECEFEELVDNALNDLSPKEYSEWLDNISMRIVELQEE